MAVRVAPLALAALLLGCTASTETTTRSTTTVPAPVTTGSETPATSAGSPSTSVEELASTTTVPTTAAPNPAWTPEQRAAADGYVHAMAVFDRTGVVGGLPVDPELDVTMVDPMLNHVRVERTNAYDRGERVRLPPQSQSKEVVKAVEVSGLNAQILACSVDDAIVYKVATGEVVNDKVSTAQIKARMRLMNGVWKLAEREIAELTDGVQPCE